MTKTMNATQRYFRCCDALDAAERNGASAKRINRLRAWVDALADESSQALVAEAQAMSDSVDAMFASLRYALTPIDPSNN